jgi:histidinol-phosphate/aromatic aminotransferase/cobyric acid decarboxylase-like protein
MTLTRRSFVTTVGLGTAGVLGSHILPGGRVLGPWTRGFEEALHAAQAGRPILLHNNENPLGPGVKAIAAMEAKLTEAGVPAARYMSLAGNLSEADREEVRLQPRERAGRLRVHADPADGDARVHVRVEAAGRRRADLRGMRRRRAADRRADPRRQRHAHAAPRPRRDGRRREGRRARLLRQPEQPGGHASHRDRGLDVRRPRHARRSETVILFDEAYHDYVTDPGYQSQIPRALDNPRVVVARTFSKAYGLAGLRVGYAIGHADTIRKMRALQYSQGTNVLGLAAALVLIEDDARLQDEAKRNTEARQFTIDWFDKAGLSSTDSQCNFIFANTGRPAREFREACRKHNVVVGRDFPPFEKTHSRISIGTMDEMKEAVARVRRGAGRQGRRRVGRPLRTPVASGFFSRKRLLLTYPVASGPVASGLQLDVSALVGQQMSSSQHNTVV